jgi:hypothetical protein
LRIRKQAHKVLAIAGIDVIPLQMQSDVAKCIRVAVDVQGSYVTSATLVVVYLVSKEMREV